MFRRSHADAPRAPGPRASWAASRRTPVERYLARLRRRAAAQAGTRALVLGLAATTLALTGAVLLAGPISSWSVAALAWTCVGAAGFGATAWALRGVRRLAGPGAARLLAGTPGGLASAARSAAELAHDPESTSISPDLIAAHALRVEHALAALPPSSVLPWRALRSPSVAGAALALLACAGVWLLHPGAWVGAWALTHPSREGAARLPLASIVARCDARLVFPAYLGRAAVSVADFTDLEAPIGTTVELTVQTRVPARAGSVEVGGRSATLGPARGGALTGRFVVRTSGPLAFAIQSGERWLHDARARTVRALRDPAPRVSLDDPASDRTIEPDAEVPIAWTAKDDGAITEVDLVIVDAAGREGRRRLGTYTGARRGPTASGTATIVASALGAQPGDRLVIRVEARDADDVSGPNVGRSLDRTLTVASDADRHTATFEAMRGALDAMLGLLADHLEQPVPESPAASRTRFEALAPRFADVADVLEALAATMRADPRVVRADAATVGLIHARTAGSVGERWAFHLDEVHSHAERSADDARTVAWIERDTLVLADLLARARLEDAATIARELHQLRQRMTSLLAELRRRPDEATRGALLAELARAEARMRELSARLAQMGTDVPGEFANGDAAAVERSEDALASLREALERGDLEAAAQRLAELGRDIERMAGALAEGESEFAESRFSEDDRAVEEAVAELRRITDAQRSLLEGTQSTRSRMAARAAEAAAAVPRETRLAQTREAHAVRRMLAGIEREALEGNAQEALDTAREAARDLEDALRAGEITEATQAAERATSQLAQLRGTLSLEAQMAGRSDARATARADAARQAAERMNGLWQTIDGSMPRVADFADDADRQAMRDGLPPQTRLRQGTDALAQRFAVGPSGAPLSAEAADALRSAARAMWDAVEMLSDADPVRASSGQDEALRHLEQLLENVQEQRSRRSRAGGGGAGEEAGSGGTPGGGTNGDESWARDAVRIPDGTDFVGPAERRRRVLDAMGDDAPTGWEDAVRRYYEAILR